jgi:RNA polymerase sigma-70 factor (ECF subfamily)
MSRRKDVQQRMARFHSLSPERERQLVEQVWRGDRGALGELLGAYHKPVYHQCLRMLGNPEDAADVAQDALMKAVQHVDDFRGGSRFGTWLFRITMNLTISHLRKSKVRSAVSLDGPVGSTSQAAPLREMIAARNEPEPAHRVQQEEDVEQLTAAIGQLEPNLRAVLLLRDLQGMDYQEIAAVVGVPVGTVKSRLFRARLGLRQALVADSTREPMANDE